MVIVRLIGGLGNQFFQYALGRTISIKNGLPLKLDISAFETYTLHSYNLNHFNIVEEIASIEEIARFDQPQVSHSRLVASGLRAAAKVFPYHLRYIKLAEAGFQFDPTVLRLRANIYLDGYWQSEKYFKESEDVLRKEFTVKHQPDSLTKQIEEDVKQANSVCLHIRRGDYVSNAHTATIHGVCTMEYYTRAITELTKTVRSPHFFIFSDEPDWARDNLKIAYPVTFVDHNDASKNYEDLRLMSRCKHFIIANSSFSWWGAWLGRHPTKLVFAPAAWFRTQERDTRDLLPDSWRVI